MIKRTLTITNKLGLHARASAKLVALAAGFASNIELERNGKRINGKSIMGVMLLAASQGTEVELIIEGKDENEAFVAIENLFSNHFGEAA